MSTSAVVYFHGREMRSNQSYVVESMHVSSDGCPDTMLYNFTLALADTQKKIDQYNEFKKKIGDDKNLKSLMYSTNLFTNFMVAHSDGNYGRVAIMAGSKNKFPTPLSQGEINSLVYDADADWVFFFDLVNGAIYVSNESDFDNKEAIYCTPLDYVECLNDDCQESTERTMRERMEQIEAYGLKFMV